MKIEKFLNSNPIISTIQTGRTLTLLLDRRLESFDVNYLQALLLVALFFEDDRRSRPKALAETFDMTKGNISHTLTSLEKKNFLERRMLPDDARGYEVCLTNTGEELSLRLIKVFDHLQNEIEAQWSDVDSLVNDKIQALKKFLL